MAQSAPSPKTRQLPLNGLTESFGLIGIALRRRESVRSQETEGVRDFGPIRAFRGCDTLFRDSGFNTIALQTVEQTIVFPSVLDYVRFQLLATPMTVLLRDQTEPERAAIISSIAARTIALSTPAMLEGGRFTFPQEAFVAIAHPYP